VAIIASLVADPILEHFRAGKASGGGIASVPWIDAKVTVSTVKLASKLVALRVADAISRLHITPMQLAHPQLFLEVFHRKPIRVVCPCCDVYSSWCI